MVYGLQFKTWLGWGAKYGCCMDRPFTIVEDDLTGAAIIELLSLHATEMSDGSPPEATHFLDLDGLRAPDITFWTIWDGDDLAGCGALRELDPSHGEVKSMRTHPDHLGRGVGRDVLARIISESRERGYQRLSLETGRAEMFAAAVHLYESEGFTPCGPFGDYPEHEFSQFMTLDLT